MPNTKSSVFISALVFSLAHLAHADVVYLKNGTKFEGKVDDLGDKIKIKLKTGTAVISKDQVLRIEKKISPEEVYREKLASLSEKDAEGYYRLAKWCEEHGLHGRAIEAFEKVIGIDPSHGGAKKALMISEKLSVWRGLKEMLISSKDPSFHRGWALEYEKKRRYKGAYNQWERMIDTADSNAAQRREARDRLRSLARRYPPNKDIEKAIPYKLELIIFKKLDVKWRRTGSGEGRHTLTEFNDFEIGVIEAGVKAFKKKVFEYSRGMARIEGEVKIISEPLETLSWISMFELDSRAERREGLTVGEKELKAHTKYPNPDIDGYMVYVKYIGKSSLTGEEEVILPPRFGWNTTNISRAHFTREISPLFESQELDNVAHVTMHEWYHQLRWLLAAKSMNDSSGDQTDNPRILDRFPDNHLPIKIGRRLVNDSILDYAWYKEALSRYMTCKAWRRLMER